MATSSSLHLLVIFLCFSHLMISLTAIRLTRGRILQAQEYEEAINTHKVKMVKRWDGENMMMRRMNVELNDYPGPGASHRHTPWAPPARA